MVDAWYDTIVFYKDIPSYLDDYFYSALYAWWMTKTWGTGFTGGWTEWPCEYLDAITAIENAHNEVESEEMEKKMKK